MNNKTKIALCLSGEPRSSMFSFPYIYESLINLGPEYEVDVYIHSWKNFRALSLYNPVDYTIGWVDEERFFKDAISSIPYPSQNSSNLNLELKYIKENTLNAGALKNTFLMSLSMRESFKLVINPYDIYIRGRLDFYFPFKLDIISFINDIKFQSNDIILPKIEIYNHLNEYSHDLIHDHFAICNLKAAKYYFNFYNHLPNIISNSEKINPHFFLKTYLDNSNLNLKSFNCTRSIDLIRSSKIITNLHLPYLDN